ncbi:MAG: cytochrome c3 family protein [Planctomycetes bacterium]|nr:cytochrome c3 family protein [Planctomycetota bacterium]
MNVLKKALLLPWRCLKWCFATRGRTVVSTFGVLCVMLGGSFAAYKYSVSSHFCHQCHFMDPYCESWSKSTHRDVDCVKCHFEPGFGNELHGKWVAVKQLASAVTGAYSSMPYAEVSDASCLRSGCHTNEELSKPVLFSDRGIGFKHETHMTEMRRGIKLACTSCHFQKMRDVHIEVDKSTCFLCHFKDSNAAVDTSRLASGMPANGHDKLGSCDTCHGPPTKIAEVGRFRVDHADFVKRGMSCLQCHVELSPKPSYVGAERCLSCHNEPEKMAKIGETGLMHVAHVTKKKMHCYQCHTLIPHKRVPSDGEADMQPHGGAGGYFKNGCALCHMDSHGPQAQLYAGTGAKGVTAQSDPMHLLGMDCIACHRAATSPSGGAANSAHATVSPTQACTECHADRYDSFVGSFRESAAEIETYLSKRLSDIEAKVQSKLKNGELLDRETYRLREKVTANLRFLAEAKAIHNPIYAIDVLRDARDTLDELGEALEVDEPDGDPPYGLEREDCGVCHDELPEPGDLTIPQGWVYPHALHAEKTGLSCEDCHMGDQHPPQASTAEASCKTCHKDDRYRTGKKN